MSNFEKHKAVLELLNAECVGNFTSITREDDTHYFVFDSSTNTERKIEKSFIGLEG